jgi:hypothetical protein
LTCLYRVFHGGVASAPCASGRQTEPTILQQTRCR